MKNLRRIILNAMVVGVLIVPGTSATPTLRTERDILTSGKPTITTSGREIMGGETAITDADGIITDDMRGMTTGAMFVMTTVATIISRRFGRISKMFAMHEMKSNKAARSCVGITTS